jgi:hypothetical protein
MPADRLCVSTPRAPDAAHPPAGWGF